MLGADLLAPTHLLLILFVALVVLGPKRLPEVGRSLGKGLRDFRDAMTTYSPENLLNTDEQLAATPPPTPPATPPSSSGETIDAKVVAGEHAGVGGLSRT